MGALRCAGLGIGLPDSVRGDFTRPRMGAGRCSTGSNGGEWGRNRILGGGKPDSRYRGRISGENPISRLTIARELV